MLREVPMRMFSKFNREKKRFERARVRVRCFHWFPVATSDALQHGVSILNTIIFSDTLCRITRVRNIVHLRNFGTLFICYSSTIFQFPDSIYVMVRDYHLSCVIVLKYLRDVKTTNYIYIVYFSFSNDTRAMQ